MNVRTPFGYAKMTGSGHGAGTVVAIVLLALVLILVSLAILGLSVWALIFGILDLNTVGPNFWNIFWIVLGSIGILLTIFGNRN